MSSDLLPHNVLGGERSLTPVVSFLERYFPSAEVNSSGLNGSGALKTHNAKAWQRDWLKYTAGEGNHRLVFSWKAKESQHNPMQKARVSPQLNCVVSEILRSSLIQLVSSCAVPVSVKKVARNKTASSLALELCAMEKVRFRDQSLFHHVERAVLVKSQ